MADTITMELCDYECVKAQYPFWNCFPLTEVLYIKGKQPLVLKVDLNIDTSTVNVLTETTAPTNEVYNLSAPQQVYIRSDDAGDTSKKIDVIGQKADGSFGTFTLTSNAADGTTPVDVGTWKSISFPIKNDAWAGNVIIDNDGSSTTVFWTLALGATGTDGILVIPDGYYGACIDGSARAIVAAGANYMLFNIDHMYSAYLEQCNPVQRHFNPDIHEVSRISIETAYLTAAFASKGHLLIAIWEA